MRFVICGSMDFANKMLEVGEYLTTNGHTVLLPEQIEQDLTGSSVELLAQRKIKYDLIRKHWEKIQISDAILVLNYEKDGTHGYIGGNTFLEMGFAHVLRIPIYTLNSLPQSRYQPELIAMEPTILNGDLDILTKH